MKVPFLVVGLSHKSASVDVREKFAMGAERYPEVLARLAGRPELAEVMFLSTCNRVEVFALPRPRADGDAADLGLSAIRGAFREHAGAGSVGEISAFLYEKQGEDAVRHIFRVAASLDSMVVGEPQILGQVKDAYDAALAAKTLGGTLGRCVSRAFAVAKRVRTETEIGAGSVSISSVAVDLARRIFGDLGDHTVLLVGAGEMAEQAARSLAKGARAIRVCNRSFDRAAQLAEKFGGSAAPLAELESEILHADVVVTSTGAHGYIVTKDLVKRAMKLRRGRTLFLIDIAVPRNVEPDVHEIDNVYVYNVDDLEEQVKHGLRSRHGETDHAEAIVEGELAGFGKWLRGLDLQPTIVALRAKTRAVLLAELERSLGGRLKHLPEPDRAALVQMVESATNKLCHGPTTQLRGDAELVGPAQRIFDLPTLDEPEERAPDAERDDADDEERVTH